MFRARTGSLILGALMSFGSLHIAQAAAVDVEFMVDVLQRSECAFDNDFVSKTFAEGMDRLENINPKIVHLIRTRSYSSGRISLVCDLDKESPIIFFRPTDGTIHLRENPANNWFVVSGLFHEFLHSTGIVVDDLFHNQKQSPEDFVTKDSIYACHTSAFPAIFEFKKLPELQVKAIERCALAEWR